MSYCVAPGYAHRWANYSAASPWLSPTSFQTGLPPVRLRIPSEDLIAFRDTNGQAVLLARYCPLEAVRNLQTGHEPPEPHCSGVYRVHPTAGLVPNEVSFEELGSLRHTPMV